MVGLEALNIPNLLEVYDQEISKNVKNKNALYNFEINKMQNINKIINVVSGGLYEGGKYNIFLIKEPKVRIIMSLNISDKLLNHFATRYILYPKLDKLLMDKNVATRKDMGTSRARKLINKYLEKLKKYDNIYVLKIDIKKYFYTINHDVLKDEIKPFLNSEEFNLISNIIDSSNKKYINERINNLNINKENYVTYEYGKGLPIGNMTSQFLSIFYLYKLDHYIVYDLKLKYYVRYMDDFIILHHDKNYLKECYKKIEDKIKNYYKLEINTNKTKISNIKDGILFLGYNYKVINKKTIIKINNITKRRIRNKVRSNIYLYKNNNLSLESLFSSLSNYYNSYEYDKHIVKNIIDEELENF